MSNKHNHKHDIDNEPKAVDDNDIEIDDIAEEDSIDAESAKEMAQEELDEAGKLRKELEETKSQLEKEKKEYLFLMAEFDNFRKRTLKEKSELIKNGGESAMRGLLPVIDDFERSIQAINENSEASAIKEGVELIYNKFVKYLEQNGVTVVNSDKGADFDTEIHEAVTTFPTDDESLKGKIIDTVQKGYKLHDKVIRHAKVVVGQ